MRSFDPSIVNVHLVENNATASEFINWIREVPDQLIGVDVETDGLDWFDGTLKLVQFGTLTEGWAVPYQDNRSLVREALTILSERKKFFVGHNMKFDLHWLEQNTGWLPSDWMYVHDTMPLAAVLNSSWSRALKDLAEFLVWAQAKVGAQALADDMKQNGWTWATVPVMLPSYWIYGVLDTILTVNLFYELMDKCTAAGVLDAYATEMAAYPVWFAMERKGMLLDAEYCVRERDARLIRCDQIEGEVFDYGISNIGSTDQLVLAFERAGVELTVKTPSGKWKMDKDTFEMIAGMSDSPLVSLVQEYRSGVKLSSTYYNNFLRYQRSDGRCHPFYWPTGARTGRTSATEPAILTVPRPDIDKPASVRAVRNAFVAPDGHVLISTDFGNVEARIFAHFAHEMGMQEAFRNGINIHQFTAQQIFKTDQLVDKSDSKYTIAKNTLFCKLFGGGVEKIAATAGISIETATEANDGLNRAFPGMKKFQRESTQVATDNLRAHGQAFIRGFDRRILAMKENNDKYYAFTNWQIQGTACVVLKKRLAVIEAMGLTQYMVAAIHDEVLAEIPEDFEPEYREMINEAMSDDQIFDVPIVCTTGKSALRWGDSK